MSNATLCRSLTFIQGILTDWTLSHLGAEVKNQFTENPDVRLNPASIATVRLFIPTGGMAHKSSFARTRTMGHRSPSAVSAMR